MKEEKKEDFDFDFKLEDGDKKAEVEVKKEDQKTAAKIITKLKAPIKKFQQLVCGELPDEQKKPITMLEIAFHQISEDLDVCPFHFVFFCNIHIEIQRRNYQVWL